MSAVKADSRNAGIEFDAHYKGLFDKETLVISINDLGDETAAADVFRVFLQISKALKSNDYVNVELACKDVSKFSIDGAYFKQLGQEYGEQNTVFTARTFPENVKPLDGGQSFERWEGGLIAVATKQMKDFNELHHRWYIDDLLKSGN